MLSYILQKVSQHHQAVFAYPDPFTTPPPTQYVVQRVWLSDLPIFSNAQKQILSVRVEFQDTTQDNAFVLQHPNPCLSILSVPAIYTLPVVRVYGLPVFGGNFENMIQVYAASTTLIPFLYVLDEITISSIDTNVFQMLDFEVLLVGLINDREPAESISAYNQFARLYLPQMFRNVFIEITDISELPDLKLIQQKVAELYVLRLRCRHYHESKIL